MDRDPSSRLERDRDQDCLRRPPRRPDPRGGPAVKTYHRGRDEAIGLATLYDFRHEGCEVGIKVGSKDLRGRGYASEAVELLVRYCFETLGLKSVRGSTLSHNTRMQRVFEKCGFAEVGDGSIISRFDNSLPPSSSTSAGGRVRTDPPDDMPADDLCWSSTSATSHCNPRLEHEECSFTGYAV